MSVELTILIPVWNNEKEIQNAYWRIKEVVLTLERRVEILFVDDGSEDATFNILQEISRSDPKVSILKLSRNYGQHPAIVAGVLHAQGHILVTMDADLQCDPGNIPKFLAKIEDGFDLVSGWRIQRNAPLFTRRMPSKIMNWVIGKVTGLKLHDYGCGMNALTRNLGSQLQHYGDQQRFLKPLACLLANKVGEVQLIERKGLQTKSRYNTWKLFGLMLDFIISFSVRPFRLVGIIGLLMSLIGCLGVLSYLAGRILFDMSAHERLQVLSLLFFLFGMLFMIFGLIGEFIVRIYHLQQQHPLYTVEQHLPSRAFDRDSK
jgi:glycosyltransferase involved in cell wall biosynthesis